MEPIKETPILPACCADCNKGTSSVRYVTTPFLSPGNYLPEASSCLYGRFICYDCAAVLEKQTMAHDGHAILYLTNVDNVLHLTNWTGYLSFNLHPNVKVSYNHGFGKKYTVHTFRFDGPDGFVWSGRQAGDMDLARCRRTKQRIR